MLIVAILAMLAVIAFGAGAVAHKAGDRMGRERAKP
jgi:hypothetical protein